MPTVTLATSLAKWLPTDAQRGGQEISLDVAGDHLRAVLDALFAIHPPLRSYVLEDHGALRHHVAVFINGAAVRDKQLLHLQAIDAGAEIFIAQALSGG